MKTNSEVYQNFLMGETIQQYCERHIDPFRVEMDHLGLNALIDAVIKPAGISVDILYLDRSEGEEVNTISFQIEESKGLSGFLVTPSIRLLYRPYVLYQTKSRPRIANIRQWPLRYNLQD